MKSRIRIRITPTEAHQVVAEAHNRAMEAHPGDMERLVAIVVDSHHCDEEPDPDKRDKSFQCLGSSE